MINFKHTGIYVHDIEIISNFYQNCFGLIPVCEKYLDTGYLYEQLFGVDSKVIITKLITEYGKTTGQGEMIEFIQVIEGTKSNFIKRRVHDFGLSHISLGVDDIDKTVSLVKKHSGKQVTDIISIGNRKCCFCSDPESNVIELIE